MDHASGRATAAAMNGAVMDAHQNLEIDSATWPALVFAIKRTIATRSDPLPR